MSDSPALPHLPALSEVSARLQTIFPETFPDRSILVGDMAARMTFVALYGGFIDGNNRWFRPSTVINFTREQAELVSDTDRQQWLSACHAPGYEPQGKPWYAPNTREPLRDDLLRNRAIPMGIVQKREGKAITSPAPIYSLSAPFSRLLDPALTGEDLEEAISVWQEKYLDTMTLKRAALLAQGVKAKSGQVVINLPGQDKTLRLGTGEAATITKAVCEVMGPWMFEHPVVVHVSHSDKKVFKELEGEAEAIGLALDPSAELPDVVIVDIAHDSGMVVCFIEVVHSDGPITELRKQALLKIAADAGIAPEHVRMITAFDDRGAPSFRKRVSELARGSEVWFRTEPNMLIQLNTLPNRPAK
jgi:hypothetical protein